MKDINCKMDFEGISFECQAIEFHRVLEELKFNPLTKEVFDKQGNYLGQGIYNGETKILKVYKK